jgi:hypothetical protein
MKAKREGSGKTWESRLESHPELLSRVERILDLVENTSGEVRRAAEAEECAIREIKALGQEVLQDWARGLAEETANQAVREGGVRAKKNGSTGTAVLGKSRSRK